LSVAELIEIAGGEVAFYDTCHFHAENVHAKWQTVSVDDIAQMIACKVMEDSSTLVKNLRKAENPSTYLGRSMYKAGEFGASTEVYARKVGGFSSTTDETLDWYEEASPGTPEGIYSTDAVRSALMCIDLPDQNDPLMDLVLTKLPELSSKDRAILIDRFCGLDSGVDRVAVLRAVDRLTKKVNGWS
jgi:hypothetical protein